MNAKKISRPKKRWDREAVLALFIGWMYAVGAFGHLVPTLLPLMLTITPWFLLIFGLIVLVPYVRSRDWPTLIWAGGTYVVTFALEAIGTKTGLVFGPYTYGNVLGPMLLEVPVVIGFNWVLVILGFAVLTEALIKNRWIALVATAAAATLFDVVLEPVAIGLGYWTWHTGHVPFQNYVAWFIISFAATFVFQRVRGGRRTLLPGYYALIQTAFFIVLLTAL
jgi:putative membrane protein